MSVFYDNLEILLERKGITKRKFQNDLSLSAGTVQKWKERGNTPRNAYLVQIANYFGVTVDYLTTPHEPDQFDKEKAMVDRILQQVREEIKTPTADISSERQKIIEMLSDVEESRLQEIKSYLEYLASKGK